MKELILELEEYAEQNKVPIIEKDSIVFIMNYIKEHNIKNILEIGSAIGYSAILMASSSEGVKVTTIEKNETRYMECLKNVKRAELDKNISVVYQDALDVNLVGVKFDMIFIDAAKGQYTKFFEKFKYFLNDGGVIVSDNLKFHGFVGNKEKIESRNLLGLVNKLEDYIEFLKSNDEFTTDFYDVGDGLSVSVKNEE